MSARKACASGPQGPRVSKAIGVNKKSFAKEEYFTRFKVSAASLAAPGLDTVALTWEAATVLTHVTSQTSSLERPEGSCCLESAMDDVIYLSICLLYTSPSPRDLSTSRMPSSA